MAVSAQIASGGLIDGFASLGIALSMTPASLIMRAKSKRLRSFALRIAGKYKLHRGTLPDFIIIGAQKAGTTSLDAYLREHPDVLPCARKEVQFFHGRRYLWGEDWYRRQFLNPADLNGTPEFSGRRLIGGEATPYYIFHPHVPERIAKMTPDAKLIALLRDPVARAYSQYQHNVRREKEQLSFADALKREEDVLPAEEERMLADPNHLSEIYHRWSYKRRGCYAEQIERYYRLFPREQLLIVKSEDFFERPQETYDQVLDFLGLTPFTLSSVTPINPGSYSAKTIPGENELRRFYEPHNRRLYDLIGRDMGW
jgi:hypothetical protein